jgi:hypothetical protein
MNQNGLPTYDQEVVLTPVPGFSQYLCDIINGRVWSNVTNKWLLDSEDCKGTGDNGLYLMTKLKSDNTSEYIPMYKHEIILSSAFGVEKSYWLSQGLQIDHIDKNPRNNKIDNLRLITDKLNKRNSNERHWNKVRLSLDIAQQLREDFKVRTISKVDWYRIRAEELNVTFRSVQNLILGKTYKVIPNEG